MVEVIVHVGMGKTGTTSVQAALERSASQLEAAGMRYLGMWPDLVSPRFNSYEGFQAFRALAPDAQIQAADALVAAPTISLAALTKLQLLKQGSAQT